MNRRDLLRGLSGASLTGLAGCIGEIPVTSSEGSSTEAGPSVGEKPPDFTVQTTAGAEVALYPVEKPTVLFFMAAWCTSCKHEENNLEQIQRQYGDDVRLISIDMDPDRDSMDDLRQFESEYGGDWIHAMGTQQLVREYRLSSLDTTYIIDQDGVTTYKDSDVTAVETFERELEKLLQR